jgi:diguanylate cyclase (GGDEF)-like protein
MKFSSNLEADYQADLAPEKIRVLKLATMLGAAMYLSFGALDDWAIPSVYHRVWVIRGVVILVTLSLLAVAMLRPQAILSRYTNIVCMMFMTWGLGVLAMICIAQPSDVAWSSYYCGLMLVCSSLPVSYLGLLPTLMVAAACVSGYVFVAIYVQGMLTRQHWPLLLTNCYFLIGSTVVGIVVAEIRQQYTRHLYLLRQALHRDIETTKEEKRQSDFLAEHDTLTEMPNRIWFMRQLETMIRRAKDAHTTVTVLFIDLNGFKPINDEYGHQFGDMVLRVVSRRIRSCVRVVDLVARLGGDEFVVAIELDQRHLSSADRLRQSLGNSISGLIGFESCEVSVTASIGTAMYPFDGDNAVELIDAADRRMYEVKRQSKVRAQSPSSEAVLLGIGSDFGIPTIGQPQ